MKICLIYNGAAHYREGVFKLIEGEFDCHWFFGPGYGGIKQLPLRMFKYAERLERKNLIGPIYWQKRETRLLCSKKYDAFFILGEIPNLSTWWGMFMHNIFNRHKKVYFWTHGYYRNRGWLRNTLVRIFMKLPYACFIYGDYAIEYMIKDGYDKDKLYPIHNSLNYDEQICLRGNFTDIYKSHFGNDNQVLLFIGRLTAEKKLHMILEAIEILKKQGSEVNCVFIGDGAEKDKLQRISKDKGLHKQVWFYGASYDEKTNAQLLHNADICISPGNVGLTCIHSMMFGCPVITSDNFAYQGPEFEAIRKGKTGDFFKDGDSLDLAKTIKAWLNNSLDRGQIRRNCYKEIDENWNPQYQIRIIKENLKA